MSRNGKHAQVAADSTDVSRRTVSSFDSAAVADSLASSRYPGARVEDTIQLVVDYVVREIRMHGVNGGRTTAPRWRGVNSRIYQ